MNVVLIGYRGTGKTTVAQQLGLSLGWDWIDADVEIEMRAGRSIAAIFAEQGEPAFRDLESTVIAELVERQQVVIAAGGGVVARAENRQAIRRASQVVWLTATVESLVERIAADATTAARRPSLTSLGGESEIRRLLVEREPWYRECATLTIDTTDRAPAEIAAEIIERLQPSYPGGGPQ
jgi:shikimate kinase